MPSPVYATIEDLGPVMAAGDLTAYQRLFNTLSTEGRDLSPADLTTAVGELAPILARRPQGVFARLALIAGAYVEWGGSAAALAENAPACAVVTLRLRRDFTELWPVVGGGEPEPDTQRPPKMNELVARFRSAAQTLGISEGDATTVAISWFDAPHWANLLITALCRREFRDRAELRAELIEVAEALADTVARVHWLAGLAAVVDDEPIVVIDPASGGGYRLTMSGVGDNYQLHTLLADRLIGDPAHGLVAGVRPRPEWVAAATTAPSHLGSDRAIERRFRLYDGNGAYISPEGRPADIAVVDGARLIALHPPLGMYTWGGGRTYENMIPTLTLDQIMTVDEAEPWRTRLAPARVTDIFGATQR